MTLRPRSMVRILIAVGVLYAAAALFVGCLRRPHLAPGSLLYKGPTELSVKPGQSFPGTGLQYVGVTDKMAEVRIDGQRALKKTGDSLDWSGSPSAGVQLDLAMRVLLISEQSLHAGGTVSLEIADVNPQAAAVGSTSETKFTVPVTYAVDKGETIAGTLITYEGRDEERGAKLGGIPDYPYRKTGDSIVWEGKLRDNVSLRLDVRVLLFSESTLRVGGTATIWVD